MFGRPTASQIAAPRRPHRSCCAERKALHKQAGSVDLMAERNQRPRPMVGRVTGLDPDQTGRQRRKETHQLVAPDRLGDDQRRRRGPERHSWRYRAR
jgi:hypothetical protein